MQLVLLGEKGKLLLSPQQVVIGDHKDTTGTIALKNKELFDNDVPAHVTETRPNLAEFQDFNVPYAFWRSENQANIHAGQQEANHNAEEEQAFLDELERLKRQEKEANEEAEALRKEFAQETENLVIQEGAAKASILAESSRQGTILLLIPTILNKKDFSHVSLLRGYHYHPLHVASYPFDQIQPDILCPRNLNPF
ncbi:hypothetical protein Tco_1142624 [Tanacetum coccineum]